MSTLIIGSLVVFLSSPHRDLNISGFGQSVLNPAVTSNNISTLAAASVSNLPQLILSIGYIVYNSIFTYLLTEVEWSSYGGESKTLRVTEKKGQQRSTHRLQLPYRYSVPLIVIGILLHWLFSNCIYIAIYNGHSGFFPYDSLPDYGFKGLQVSPVALLITLITIPLVGIFPFFLACVPRSSAMVVGGACSAVVSAACHCITPGQHYISPVQRGGLSPLKPENRLLYPETSLWSQNAVVRQNRVVEAHNESSSLASAGDYQPENDARGSFRCQTNPQRGSSEADPDIEDCKIILGEEIGKPATENFLQTITQGKLTWGIVWKTLLEDPHKSENTSQSQYYWVGSVLVPGVAPESPRPILAHLSFGTAEQVTGFSNQGYSFA
ncbi:hypothetical protein GQX73_g8057 [Xylaria multiplex]|uniref:Uncharacterized protein n=1 Tax=Xylaria multiplex TaxID=323545 RepID=A0A7C8MLQ4_9PEZI|nr:hypothetical protein GQX73_g8057 [Xylaria multiplex]